MEGGQKDLSSNAMKNRMFEGDGSLGTLATLLSQRCAGSVWCRARWSQTNSLAVQERDREVERDESGPARVATCEGLT